MILDATGKPYRKTKKLPTTDVYALPTSCKVPENEYRKAMKLLQRSDIRETLARGERQRNDKLQKQGIKAKLIYLDVCRPSDKAARDAKPLLDKHQEALVSTIQKRDKEGDFE